MRSPHDDESRHNDFLLNSILTILCWKNNLSIFEIAFIKPFLNSLSRLWFGFNDPLAFLGSPSMNNFFSQFQYLFPEMRQNKDFLEIQKMFTSHWIKWRDLAFLPFLEKHIDLHHESMTPAQQFRKYLESQDPMITREIRSSMKEMDSLLKNIKLFRQSA